MFFNRVQLNVIALCIFSLFSQIMLWYLHILELYLTISWFLSVFFQMLLSSKLVITLITIKFKFFMFCKFMSSQTMFLSEKL